MTKNSPRREPTDGSNDKISPQKNNILRVFKHTSILKDYLEQEKSELSRHSIRDFEEVDNPDPDNYTEGILSRLHELQLEYVKWDKLEKEATNNENLSKVDQIHNMLHAFNKKMECQREIGVLRRFLYENGWGGLIGL